MPKEEKIPLFVPPLGTILISEEDNKGTPLTEDEVREIRDNASCIMMDQDDARTMEESRGYKDIDPENCWYEWQQLRRELGRKPDIDAGAKTVNINSNDQEYQQTIIAAQNSLDNFFTLIREQSDEIYPMVKILLSEETYQAYMWLIVREVQKNLLIVEIYELPSEFQEYTVGMTIEIPFTDVQDWMINNGGTLFGGYSLRYTRNSLDDSEKDDFDERLGVHTYA